MKKLAFGAAFAVLALLLYVPYIFLALWFLPAILGLVGPFWRRNAKPESAAASRTRSLLGAALCGPWALALLELPIPSGLAAFLGSSLVADPSEEQGRFSGSLMPGELLGFVALVSIGGCIGLIAFAVTGLIARMDVGKSGRVWARRLATVLLFAGLTFLAYKFTPGYWKLVAMVGALVGTGFVIDDTDPRSVVN